MATPNHHLHPIQPFDAIIRTKRGTDASPHRRMERLLRGTGAPAGLLFNGLSLRLISAPRGESSGRLDFRVQDMVQTAGRPIAAAMRLLLNERRLLAVPQRQRLAGLLAESRKFQNEVSERLAEQVLHALYELLRGFQAAHDESKGELLATPLRDNPDDIYRGLLTLVLRLVFLLYAEERDLLPQDDTYLSGYSLSGLRQRLAEDAAQHPDTMDQPCCPKRLRLARHSHPRRVPRLRNRQGSLGHQKEALPSPLTQRRPSPPLRSQHRARRQRWPSVTQASEV